MDVPIGTSIEIWFQDEMRVGQKNGCVRQWAARGTRPSQPADQRYANAYVFGAVCPARDTGAALVLPEANTWAMQQHLDATSKLVAPDSHAVMLLDNAGWHRTKKLKWPANISPLFIPPGCPELNAAENIWQYLRQTYLSNRVFANYEGILDAASDAWNRLLAEGGRITSIATRDWAVASR
jgi:DDE superfamily endonuclease